MVVIAFLPREEPFEMDVNINRMSCKDFVSQWPPAKTAYSQIGGNRDRESIIADMDRAVTPITTASGKIYNDSDVCVIRQDRLPMYKMNEQDCIIGNIKLQPSSEMNVEPKGCIIDPKDPRFVQIIDEAFYVKHKQRVDLINNLNQQVSDLNSHVGNLNNQLNETSSQLNSANIKYQAAEKKYDSLLSQYTQLYQQNVELAAARPNWFTSPVGSSCNELCRSKGLTFDVEGSRHVGNDRGRSYYPNKANGRNWVSIECSSTDNNTNWGADGSQPDGNFRHPACHVNCACK